MKAMLTAIALSAALATSGASAQGINLTGPWQCVALCAGPPRIVPVLVEIGAAGAIG